MCSRSKAWSRFLVYESNQSITNDGINFSGSFKMVENIRSSNLLCSEFNNSFNRFGFFSSIFILISSFLIYLKNFGEMLESLASFLLYIKCNGKGKKYSISYSVIKYEKSFIYQLCRMKENFCFQIRKELYVKYEILSPAKKCQ